MVGTVSPAKKICTSFDDEGLYEGIYETDL